MSRPKKTALKQLPIIPTDPIVLADDTTGLFESMMADKPTSGYFVDLLEDNKTYAEVLAKLIESSKSVNQAAASAFVIGRKEGRSRGLSEAMEMMGDVMKQAGVGEIVRGKLTS